MIIMALDHTRDYFHSTAMTGNPLDPATTTIPLFFTRWVTHFCAPAFVFLSGLSAYLSSQNKTVKEMSAFLAKRGLWLIFVDVVIMTFGLTFNPFYDVVILQVIWAIGCSMLLLSLFIKGSYKTILITGLVLVIGHNILDLISLPEKGATVYFIKILVNAFGTFIPIGSTHKIWVLYSILPWTGIMFLGYAAGKWFRKDFDSLKRQTNLLYTGFSLIGLFLVLRFINVYGDPSPRKEYDTILANFLSFLNVSKYPPSLEYTCIMLGPALIFMALCEQVNNRFSKVLSIYGRVPFFYYVIHFYLLHSLLVILFFAAGNGAGQIGSFPFYFRPAHFGFPLWAVYLIWLAVVGALYQPCVWFYNYKMNHSNWWLKYL